MRRLILYIICFIPYFANISGQLSEGGIPLGFDEDYQKGLNEINTFYAKKLDIKKRMAEDEINNNKVPLRYAIYENVSLDIKKKGTRSLTPEGALWRLRIVAPKCFSISLIFSKYNLPPGANLYIYDHKLSSVFGAFTSLNNKKYGTFTVADFPSDTIIIEYDEPENVDYAGQLVLGKIGKSYRSIRDLNQKAENYELDVNCPPGDAYQMHKHAVAALSYQTNNSGYFCSGALINNANNDGTPYFLTANHCVSTIGSAESLVTYFNYETTDCNGSIMNGNTLSGSELLATDTETDFTLLQLSENPPVSYKAYYAGWNASPDTSFARAAGIHHPVGLPKKISLDQNRIVPYPFEEPFFSSPTTVIFVTKPDKYWKVVNDEGNGFFGSSGSPLFDDQGKIRGQVRGTGPTELILLYGRLSESWNNDDIETKSLKHWLDPDDSGILIQEGYYPEGNSISSFPYTEFQNVCVDAPVQLLDGSYPEAETWNWMISPSTFEFIEGTDSSSQSPQVIFTANDSYSITLEVSKDAESDTRTRTDYIVASDQLQLSINTSGENKVCRDDFDTYYFIGKGADSLVWDVAGINKDIMVDSFTLHSDTLVIAASEGFAPESSLAIKITLYGYSGSCAAEIIQTLDIQVTENDSVKNAFSLSPGSNGPFSNLCAGIEANEPFPELGECTGPGYWCQNKYGPDNLQNSVWFKFTGVESGLMSISAPGFDTQLAVYKASSAENLLSGNPDMYEIIAANDNYNGAEKYWSAEIKRFNVEPGESYWLQVDGGANGVTGTFTLLLSEEEQTPNFVDESDFILEGYRVYPNPASNQITIQCLADTPKDPVEMSLYALSGEKIFQDIIYFNNEEQSIIIPSKLKNGMYILRLSTISDNYLHPLFILK